MSLEPGRWIKVFFPQSGKDVRARVIRPQEIEDGGHYLVDRDHNAGLILQPEGGQAPPKCRWEVKE